LTAIEAAVAASERRHCGELRFVVEAHLSLEDLVWRRKTPRQRALELFSLLRVWDTEQNNGVLVYVLLADRAVEILADRAIHARLGDGRWQEICKEMQSCFARGDFEQGALRGIELITADLERHFPGVSSNELPDKPLML